MALDLISNQYVAGNSALATFPAYVENIVFEEKHDRYRFEKCVERV